MNEDEVSSVRVCNEALQWALMVRVEVRVHDELCDWGWRWGFQGWFTAKPTAKHSASISTKKKWIYGFRDLRIHDSFPEIRVCIRFFLVCEWAWFWAGLWTLLLLKHSHELRSIVSFLAWASLDLHHCDDWCLSRMEDDWRSLSVRVIPVNGMFRLSEGKGSVLQSDGITLFELNR